MVAPETVLDADKDYSVKYELCARVRRYVRCRFNGYAPLDVPNWPVNTDKSVSKIVSATTDKKD